MGRTNYSMSELEHMLESACQYLPILGAEWDLVAECQKPVGVIRA